MCNHACATFSTESASFQSFQTPHVQNILNRVLMECFCASKLLLSNIHIDKGNPVSQKKNEIMQGTSGTISCDISKGPAPLPNLTQLDCRKS